MQNVVVMTIIRTIPERQVVGASINCVHWARRRRGRRRLLRNVRVERETTNRLRVVFAKRTKRNYPFKSPETVTKHGWFDDVRVKGWGWGEAARDYRRYCRIPPRFVIGLWSDRVAGATG